MKKKHLLSEGFVSFYEQIILLCFSLSVLFLTYISFFSTTILSIDEYGHFFLPDSPMRNLLAVMVFVVILILFGSLPPFARFCARIESDEAFFRRVRSALLIATALAALFWVLSARMIPVSDQFGIQDGAAKLHLGDYSMFEKGEYFYRFPQQYGLLLISYVFSGIFGSYNYIAIQIFNVVALVVILRELSELCACFHFRRIVQLGVVLEGFLFFPLILYCSYIYGTIPGLAAALVAIRLECQAFRMEKGWLRTAILSAGCILLSVLFKSNYQIFLIGMTLAAFAELLRTRNPRILTILAFLLLAAAIGAIAPRAVVEHMLGKKLDQPVSFLGFIAMGLTDGFRAPGAFNGLNPSLYKQAGYQTDIHAALAREVIINRLLHFREDKYDTFRFFTQKLAYEWNNPDFQSFWNTIYSEEKGGDLAAWTLRFISWKSADRCSRFLNVLQSLNLTGICLYVILFQKEHKDRHLIRLLLPMIYFGGFVFQLFWEAGPRYTLAFYIPLFPYSFAGYDRFIQCFRRFLSCYRSDPAAAKTKAVGKLRLLVPYCCVMLVGLLLLSVVYTPSRKTVITSDAAMYSEFLEECGS